jgi:nitroreductase
MFESQLPSRDAVSDAGQEPADGAAPKIIALPQPDLTAGLPLMAALSFRESMRAFSPTPLTLATLSDLLWAADGVNRPVSGGRTSPHALNEIDIYVSLPNGLYRYDAPNHQLLLKRAADVRELTGYQEFAGTAPVDLVYVAKGSRLQELPDPLRERLPAATAGAIAQNVALLCASIGLANVIRGWIDQPLLASALQLDDDELPTLAQTVGLPAASADRYAVSE